MSLLEQAKQRYEQHRLEARKLAAESAEDGITAERREELLTQMERAADAAEAADKDVKRYERVYGLQARQDARRELTADGPGRQRRAAGTGDGTVTEDALRNRSRLIHRRRRGGHLSDRDAALASEVFPVERNFRRVIAARVMGYGGLSRDQAREWDDYVGVAQRAWANPQANEAGEGAEFVPEYFYDMIFEGAKYEGRMADDMGMTVFRNPTIGTVNIPSVTDATSQAAARQAQGTDGTTRHLATAETKLVPDKDSVLVPINSEILLGDYVGFEAWLSGSVGMWFGRRLNTARTLGTGATGQGATGLFAALTNATRTATATALVEADITALLGALDVSYWMRPTAYLQMHANIELLLIALKDPTGGNRIYDRTPDGRLILPRIGDRYSFNNRLAATPAINAKLMIAGDMTYYGVAYGGAMRVERDYSVLSDQHIIGWFLHHDGKPINVGTPRPVATLAGKSS